MPNLLHLESKWHLSIFHTDKFYTNQEAKTLRINDKILSYNWLSNNKNQHLPIQITTPYRTKQTLIFALACYCCVCCSLISTKEHIMRLVFLCILYKYTQYKVRIRLLSCSTQLRLYESMPMDLELSNTHSLNVSVIELHAQNEGRFPRAKTAHESQWQKSI